MLRSRADSPGRFQRSPSTTPFAYFSRAGATARTSSVAVIVFDPSRLSVDRWPCGRRSITKVRLLRAVSWRLSSGGHWVCYEPCGDERGAKHGDRAGEKDDVHAGPFRDQPKCRACEALSQVEEGGVGAHRKAAALCGHPPDRLDAEA